MNFDNPFQLLSELSNVNAHLFVARTQEGHFLCVVPEYKVDGIDCQLRTMLL